MCACVGFFGCLHVFCLESYVSMFLSVCICVCTSASLSLCVCVCVCTCVGASKYMGTRVCKCVCLCMRAFYLFRGCFVNVCVCVGGVCFSIYITVRMCVCVHLCVLSSCVSMFFISVCT